MVLQKSIVVGSVVVGFLTSGSFVTVSGLPDAGTAWAGQYDVYSCHTPSGASAPIKGWSPWVTPDGEWDQFAIETCKKPGGALIAALGQETVHNANLEKAQWEFAPPSGEAMAGATLWRAGDNAGGGVAGQYYQFGLAGPTESEPFDSCLSVHENCSGLGNLNEPISPSNLYVVPRPNLGGRLYAFASCGGEPPKVCSGGKGDENAYAVAIYVYAADITLEQPNGPTATSVAGSLATASSVAGSADVAFDATDSGSGVYQAVFAVDGSVVQATTLDENGGHCASAGTAPDGRPAFLEPQPCLPDVSVDVPFDTAGLPNGDHQLVVTVTDPAGNSAVVLDKTIDVVNPTSQEGGTRARVQGQPNGTNASAQADLAAGWLGSKRARISGPYGKAHTIAGHLTAPGGEPIAGAQLECDATAAYAGARAAPFACPKTDSAGRFELKIPAGAGSRTIELAYKARTGEPVPVATRTLGLVVRAGIRLRVAPQTTSVGKTIHFMGIVLGGPQPKGGKPVVLEARSPGGPWIEFDVVRATAKGRFKDAYTFKFGGPVSYTFRAVCEAEADFPYATGASDLVRVFER
jgi:hypothetical protein